MTAKTKLNILKVSETIMIINTIASVITGLYIEALISVAITFFNNYIINDLVKNPEDY